MTREGRSPAALIALGIAMLVTGTAHASPGWTPRETLAGLQAFVIPIAAGDGTVTGVFTQTVGGHSVVMAVERPPGGRMSAPLTLSQAPADECTVPAVAVNHRGDVIVVWQRKTATTNRVEAAFKPAGGSWQAPTPIAEDTDTGDMTPQVAIAPSGEAIAVWRHYTGTRDVIRAGRRPAGATAWLVPENISPAGSTPSVPQVEVADNGTFTAAWKETTTPQGVTTKGVRAATLPAGGQWTVDGGGSLAVDSFSFDLAVGSTGRVAIAYPGYFSPEGFAVKAVVRDPGGAWGAPGYIGVESGYMDPVHAAIDDDGVVSVTFVSTGGNEIRGSRLTLPKPAWTTPFDLARGAFSDTYHPVVASGAAGRSIAAWRGDNGRGLNQVQASTVAGSAEWSVPQDLDSGGSPEVAMDGLGNGIVMWTNTAGLNLAAHDISPPDILGVNVPATVTRGGDALFAINARDRWSALQSITWDFGDGQTATGATPTHTYAANGTYPVRVTATDVLGNASTADRTVTVTDPPPPPPVDPTPTATPQTGFPTPTPTATPTRTPTPKVTKKKPTRITITVKSGFQLPGQVSPKVACGSSVGLTLRKQKTVLAKESAKLTRKGRTCHFSATFTLTRTKVGSAKTLRCSVRYRETKALGGRTWNITVKVST